MNMKAKDPLLFFSKKAKKAKTFSDWSGYEYRPQQEKMARKVWGSLENESILLLEAGMGVGKTLAYLLPLLYFSKKAKVRVAVSTETKSLQQQILRKDFPIARKILDQNSQAELCLGASNFVCKRRLQDALEKGTTAFSEREELEKFLDWESSSSTGIRWEYPNFLSDHFWNKINRDALDCLSSRCPYYDSSPYFVARRLWQKADLLILNHSLLANHFALDSKLLPEFQYLIIDEAHRFPEILQSAFRLQGSMQEMRSLLNEEDTKERSLIKDLEALYLELETKIFGHSKKKERVTRELPLREAFRVINSLEKLKEDLEKKLALIASQRELGLDQEENLSQNNKELQLQARVSRIENFRKLIEKLAAEKEKNEVLWLEKRFTNNSSQSLKDILIFCSPLSGGNFLQENIFSQLSAVVMTSATLSASGKEPFRYISKEFGFRAEEEPESLCLDSPFDYEKQALLYLPKNIADPVHSEEKFYADIAKEIHSLLELSQGGAFVLFSSLRSLRACQNLLEADPVKTRNYEICSQLSLGANLALKLFENNKKKNSVLLGLATFWQGIDIPGDRLRMVILTRIPFRPPDEPVFAARLEAEKEAGANPFYELQVPAAILSMRQGFGRLIRSFTDRGVVALLDPRLHRRSYGREILKALPPAQPHTQFHTLSQAYEKLFNQSQKQKKPASDSSLSLPKSKRVSKKLGVRKT